MDDQTNWYKTFFNGLFLELWANAMPEEYTAAEVKFIKSITSLSAGKSILDVPCGCGRHSIVFAKEGYRVTGIDIAHSYIQQLQNLAQAQKLPIEAIHADILTYELNDTFDLAVCLGNSSSYFSYYPMLQFVQKIYNSINSGGIFLIHTGVLAESILPLLKENEWMQVQDMVFLIKRSYHAYDSVLQCNYSIISKGQREDSTAYQYVFTLAEVRRMLTEAGFSTLDCYSGIDQAAFKFGDRQVYIVARK